MQNINNKLLWCVKIVITIFNVPSTGYVFFDLLRHTSRPEWLVYFNTIMAVVAIDVVFLWIIGVLEDESKPTLKRLPAAITSIMLAAGIVWIGYRDEGTLSFVPRLGLLLLVLMDLTAWVTDFWEHYFSREHVEQRIRNREVINRRKAKAKAHKKAIKRLAKPFEEQYYARELAQLDTKETVVKVVTERSVELPDGIFKIGTGYGWTSPHTGEEFVEKKLGGEYSLRGAVVAMGRHVRTYENGNDLQ